MVAVTAVVGCGSNLKPQSMRASLTGTIQRGDLAASMLISSGACMGGTIASTGFHLRATASLAPMSSVDPK